MESEEVCVYLTVCMSAFSSHPAPKKSWNYGDHSFVYKNIVPKTKEILLEYTGSSMQNFLQCKIEDVK